ncbi:MAG: hypothetical protein WHX52_02420 [Anaerolineae bacterium]|mgnify:CR=1 FL=1
MLTRRNFLKFLVGVGNAILLPPFTGIGKFGSSNKNSSRRVSQTLFSTALPLGEVYAGFVLLPEGSPVPAYVQYPKSGIPTFCGVGEGASPTAVSKPFRTVEETAKKVNFSLYTFGSLPENLRLTGAHLLEHSTGEVFAVLIDFQSYNKCSKNWQTTVSIWAQPEFPKPFPLWSSMPVEPDGPAVVPQKVDFLPSPGIMVATRQGAVFHWIRDDVLYTFIAEPGLPCGNETSSSYDEALSLVSSLVLTANLN